MTDWAAFWRAFVDHWQVCKESPAVCTAITASGRICSVVSCKTCGWTEAIIIDADDLLAAGAGDESSYAFGKVKA